MEMGHSPQRLESLAANCVGKNQAGVEESAELDRGRLNNGQTERTYHQGPLGAEALWTAAQLKINLSGKEPIVRKGQGFDLFTGQADIQLTHMAALL